MAELGELRQTLTVQWERYAWLMVAGLVTVGLWLAALVAGRVSLGLFLMAVVMVKLMIAAQVVPALLRTVEVHEHGLRVTGWPGPRELRFDELEALYIAAFPRLLPLPGEPRTGRVLRLLGTETDVVVPDDVEGFDSLLARCANELDSRGAASALADYEAGEPLHLGLLTIDRDQGLTCGEQTLSWAEVGPVLCRGGVLRLAEQVHCPLALVPNPHWLLRLLEQRQVEVRGLREVLGGAVA